MSRSKTKPREARRPGRRAAAKGPRSPSQPYRTTRVPLPSPALDALPQAVRDHYEALRVVAPKAPKKAIEALERLVAEHPEVPQFLNLLVVARSAAGDRAGAEECIRRAYAAHPDYLFARLNLAELCLARGELDRVPELLGRRLDLRALVPERTVFHVSEVVPFCALTAEYLHRRGETAAAEVQYEALRALAPKDPLTRKVARLLHPPLLARLLRRRP